MKKLEEMARTFEKALRENEIKNIVNNIMNGAYSEKDYNIMVEYLDTSKDNLGKRNFNLVAYIGNRVIEQYFIDEYEQYLNRNQTLAIYKHLSDTAKDNFSNLVRISLIECYENF